MSSWKLTKKLKETNFLRGTSSNRQQNNAATSPSDQDQPTTPQSSHSGRSSAEQQQGVRGVSSRDTLVESSSSSHTPSISNSATGVATSAPSTTTSFSNTSSSSIPASSPVSPSDSQYSRTNTLTEKSQQTQRSTVTSASAASSAHHGHHHQGHHQNTHQTNSASASNKLSNKSSNKSTSANPRLLRVTIYELRKLVVSQYRQNIPTWAFDRTSTKPPPVYLVLEYDKTQILLYAIGGTVEEPVWDKTTSFDVAANSQAEPLSISCYLRTREVVSDAKKDGDAKNGSSAGSVGSGSSGSANGNGAAAAAAAAALRNGDKKPQEEVRLKDILLGTVVVQPASFNQQEQLPLAGATLAMKCELHNTKNQPLSIEDFTLLKVVGKGSFGKVMQVRKTDTRQIYALKTIRKAHIVSKSEVGHTLAERTVLAKIHNPFIVPLKFSFQSPEKLYLVLAFVNGGELFHHLQREGRFDLNRARFYTAELLCALECLHEYNVIYRDLKPENILLDYTGHIALCDFGLCKLNMGSKDQTSTFCGTPEYLAPELLLGQGYTKSVDWWTLGVLFYEMLTGLPPFYDQNINTMYHKIVKDPLTFPVDMDREAKSLISGLLDRDPLRRLGTNGASEIKAHPFFHQIDWKYLLNKKYAAPFLPSVASAVDTSNFDSEFTNEVPMDSVVDKEFFLSESVQQQFGGWSYSNESRLASSGKW